MQKMQSKRILIMAAHFHPYTGGLENFALDLGIRFVKRGHKVDVFTYNLNDNNLANLEQYGGLTIYRFPCTSILGKTYTLPRFNNNYKKMLRDLMSNKYDTIITNTRFFTTSYLGKIYSKQIKKKNPSAKFIHIEHGNVHVIHKNPVVTFIAWLYDYTCGRAIFRSADLVVGISSPCADFAKKFGAKKTAVIHNSIDSESFSKKISTSSKQKLRKKLKIKSEEFVIINGIGRLIYAKGLQDTMNAVKDMKDIVVINMGDGPFKDNLKDLSKILKVKTIFTGTIDKKEIINYLSIADLFVNPSYSEGLPTCVLEAGSAKVAVIATNVGGTKEIVSSQSEGILVEPGNVKELEEKILILKNNKNMREKLAKTLAEKINKEFDWNKNIKKFEEIL